MGYSKEMNVESTSIGWYLNVNPPISRPEEINFDFGLYLPTIAPLTSVLDMRRSGFKLREDLISSSPWKNDISMSRPSESSISTVKFIIEQCSNNNCANYHDSIDQSHLMKDLDSFADKLESLRAIDVVNASASTDIFDAIWDTNLVTLKIMDFRYRYNQYLTKENLEPVPLTPNPVSDGVVDRAKRLLSLMTSIFERWQGYLDKKATFLNSLGSNVKVRLMFNPQDPEHVQVSYFALASGRSVKRPYACPDPNQLISEFMHISPEDGQTPVYLPAFKTFLSDLMYELLDMEDHNIIESRRKKGRNNRKRVGKLIDFFFFFFFIAIIINRRRKKHH